MYKCGSIEEREGDEGKKRRRKRLALKGKEKKKKMIKVERV